MAENREGWGVEMDANAHVSTYENVLTGAKWISGAVILTLVLMAIFLL